MNPFRNSETKRVKTNDDYIIDPVEKPGATGLGEDKFSTGATLQGVTQDARSMSDQLSTLAAGAVSQVTRAVDKT